jgi:hypothetical protein
MNLQNTIEHFITELGSNVVTASAYDTAWVAAVPDTDGTPRFPAAVEWLRRHQHEAENQFSHDCLDDRP